MLTTNLRLEAASGNLLITTEDTGLPRDSVVNVSQLITLDKAFLAERAGQVRNRTILQVEDGIRLALAL